MLKPSNPTLNEKTFAEFSAWERTEGTYMTLNGAVAKCFLLLAIVIGTAAASWMVARSYQVTQVMPWMFGSAIAALIVGLAGWMKPDWSPVIAPSYAIVEGAFVGLLSYLYQSLYQGIVIQAAGLTLGVLLVILAAYISGIAKVTPKMRMIVIAATGGVMVFYLVSFALGMFGISVPMIHSGGPIGIGFSLFVIVLASFNLLLDFDMIDEGASKGAPKYMEWYCGFAVIMHLVWLYLEILRLLAKLQRD